MVLRHLYIQHENKKRQQEIDDRELAPYQDYLDETIERALARERAILTPKRGRNQRSRISLAEALVKLPLKSMQELDNRLWLARREKRLADQFRREFLEWLRTTKPNPDAHDPQERVRLFARKFKWPILNAYEQGRRDEREALSASHDESNHRNAKTEN